VVFGISGQIAGGAVAGPIAAVAGWRGMLAFCACSAVVGAVTLLLAARRAAAEPVTRFDPAVALRRYRTILANPTAVPLYTTVMIEGRAGFRPVPLHRAADDRTRHRRHGGKRAGDRRLRRAAGCSIAAGATAAGALGPAGVVRSGGVVGALALIGFALAPALWVVVASGLLLGCAFYMIHNFIQVRATELSQQFRRQRGVAARLLLLHRAVAGSGRHRARRCDARPHCQPVIAAGLLAVLAFCWPVASLIPTGTSLRLVPRPPRRPAGRPASQANRRVCARRRGHEKKRCPRSKNSAAGMIPAPHRRHPPFRARKQPSTIPMAARPLLTHRIRPARNRR